MRHVNAMMLSRWTVAALAMLIPSLIGCGAKTESVQQPARSPAPVQTPAPTVAAPPQATPEAPTESAGPFEPRATEPISDDDLVREVFGGEAGGRKPQNAAGENGDEPIETERPQSLFRSIGRALQKGATDAVGVTSSNSEEPR